MLLLAWVAKYNKNVDEPNQFKCVGWQHDVLRCNEMLLSLLFRIGIRVCKIVCCVCVDGHGATQGSHTTQCEHSATNACVHSTSALWHPHGACESCVHTQNGSDTQTLQRNTIVCVKNPCRCMLCNTVCKADVKPGITEM